MLMLPERLPPLEWRQHILSSTSELQELENILKEQIAKARLFSWDTETSGFDYFKKARIIGHVFGYDLEDGKGPRASYLPIRHQTVCDVAQLPPEPVTALVQTILGNAQAKVTTWNGKFDLLFARTDGITVRADIEDGMIAVALIDENRPKELESCARDFGIDPDAYFFKELVKEVHTKECRRYRVPKSKAPGYAWIPIPLLGRYACKDGYNTLALSKLLLPFAKQHWGQVYDREKTLLRHFERAEWIGTPIDIPYLQALHVRALARIDELEKQIHRIIRHPLRLGSDAAERDFLYGHCRYPVKYLTKDKDDPEHVGQPAVDERALKGMIREQANPRMGEAIALMLLHREQSKLVSTYTLPIIERCDANGYLHATFKQVGTKTGRASCSQPNIQNIPSDDKSGIRRAFLVPKGKVRLLLDFGQMELRVLAFCAGEPSMIQAFIDGMDIHSFTSMELFHSIEKKWRRPSKVINFGLAYQMSAIGVMESLNSTANPEEGADYVTEEQAAAFLTKFHQRFPRVNEFCEELVRSMSRQSPPSFTNMFGRTRRVPDLTATWRRLRNRARRKAIASIIQGTAADVAKISINRCCERLAEARASGRYDGEFIMMVHDENQIDVDYDGAGQAVVELKAEMERFPEFAPVPIIADAEWSTSTWADKKPVWPKKKG